MKEIKAFIRPNKVNEIVQQLKEKGSALSSEMFEKVNQLLNKDLEELLGEKKEDFVNKFIKTNAEDLVDKFLDWKKNAISCSRRTARKI